MKKKMFFACLLLVCGGVQIGAQGLRPVESEAYEWKNVPQ